MTAPPVIRSARNPVAQRLRRLRRRAATEPDVALVEGGKLIEEALAGGAAIVALAGTADALAAADRVARRAPRGHVHRISRSVLRSVSGLDEPPGLLAIVSRPRADPERVFADVPLVVVAVSVQDPGNLGGLVRTAAGAGASGVVLTEGCADPFGWKALRGSMGSAFTLPPLRVGTPAAALDLLRARGVRAVAAAPGGGAPYAELDYRQPTAFVLGSEGSGLAADVVAAADAVVSIPLAGHIASLNVGVAAGVLLFEAARQRRLGR